MSATTRLILSVLCCGMVWCCGCDRHHPTDADRLLKMMEGHYWQVPINKNQHWQLVHTSSAGTRVLARSKVRSVGGTLELVFLTYSRVMIVGINGKHVASLTLPETATFRSTWYYGPPRQEQGGMFVLYQETDLDQLTDQLLRISEGTFLDSQFVGLIIGE